MIRKIKPGDAEGVAEIYNYYIANTIVTFEEDAISSDGMETRITEIESSDLPWFVADENGEILGYAYASKWKGRCAYRFSVEVTVYLSPKAVAKGLGTELYTELFSCLKEKSIRTVIGGISLPNPASVTFHEKFTMEKVAHFKEVGFKFGKWIDVGYWQGALGNY